VCVCVCKCVCVCVCVRASVSEYVFSVCVNVYDENWCGMVCCGVGLCQVLCDVVGVVCFNIACSHF
jgi:hypothetical protein